MKKIVNKLIDECVVGVDTYSHNGSTWLIFTETKQWVIELTESKTLWYNYNFFKNLFNYTSMDVVENQHYITQWVEDNIINVVKHTNSFDNPSLVDVGYTIKNGVKENSLTYVGKQIGCDDAIQNGVKEIQVNVTKNKMSNFVSDSLIQNGVKETSSNVMMFQSMKVEDTIQNGVRHTIYPTEKPIFVVEDAIENGVKEIYDYKGHRWDVKDVIQDGVRDISPMTQYTDWQVKEIIENGVKDTQLHKGIRPSSVEHTIENGVKETNKSLRIDGSLVIEDTIQNGVKKTTPSGYLGSIEMNGKIVHQIESPKQNNEVEDTIQNGVKHTEIGWHQCNNVDDVIEKVVIETKGDASQNPMGKVTKVIKNGIKKSIAAGYEKPNSLVYLKSTDEIDEVLENGVRHTLNTEYMPKTMVEDIIENGVKETKTPGKDGDILSTIEWMEENKSNSYTKMIDDVIDNGVKKTMLRQHITDGNVETIIETGIKEVQPLPDQSGELIGYGNYYHGKEDRTKAFYNYLEDTIKFGVKESLG
jgi:hypothetical protein